MRIYFAGPLFTPYERGYIDECAAQLRADGFEVFVPHEHELAQTDTTAGWIFAKDMDGLGPADAVLALLDGPTVDDGTACEIGIFYALMQSDPAKKGVIGFLDVGELRLYAVATIGSPRRRSNEGAGQNARMPDDPGLLRRIRFTVETLGRYHLHDVAHHLHDIGR